MALVSVLAAGSAWGSAYRIPEQSADSTAKAGAHVASANGADSSYYNPSAMHLADDAWQVEVDGIYIYLPSVTYDDNRSPMLSGESEAENFLLPTLFMVSPDYNNFRIGFSITGPFGLSKRWKDQYATTFAEEYSLKVFDINPTLSYKTCDMFSIAVGARMIYSEAKVSSKGIVDRERNIAAERWLDGDTTEFGWNIAATLTPVDDLKLAVTYRSHVDLDLEGDVIMGTNFPVPNGMTTTGSVTIPAPAVLTVAGAYTFNDLTVEMAWDRTFWSEYESIDISYDSAFTNPVFAQVYGSEIPKNWDDSSAYRISVSWAMTEALTFMAGFAYDESPVPDETLNFELPDSDAWLYSLGARYKVNEAMEISVGYLYDYKEEREVSNTYVNGTFTDAVADLVTVGVTYKF